MLGALRKLFRQERLPAWFRWICAAEGIAFWIRLTERGLARHLQSRERARELLARAAGVAFRRRYELLRTSIPELPALEDDPGALAMVIKGLYPGPLFRAVDWIMRDAGGPARGIRTRWRARRALASLDAHARSDEVTVHLGDLLVCFTETLSAAGVPQTNSVLGGICHDFGVRITRLIKWLLRMPDTTESAIEVLRMGEYLFRVNPEHQSGVEGARGFIEGNACPWYVRPGWGAMHCGIFGRFQDGCASVFGRSYRLTRTIPRHGGDVCRVELKPIVLRRKAV
jgi:hypothetical protein